MGRYESIRAVDEFEEYIPYYVIEYTRSMLDKKDIDEDVRDLCSRIVKYADEVIGTHRMDHY